ncbi:MAG: VWA domain-containing protein, partial [Deltaproteobacteria bacterium]|nr:VWA domain-containing protein [Deltaproteobacteria bacterium]
MSFQGLIPEPIRLNDTSKKAYDAACASVTHLRTQTSGKFLKKAEKKIKDTESLANCKIIFDQAEKLCTANWSLFLPFLEAAAAIPEDHQLIPRLAHTAVLLAAYDIDAAVTFLTQTPMAVENLNGKDKLKLWGRQGLDAFEAAPDKKKIWKAIKAYFIESSKPNCGYPLDRWSFFLEQAIRISATCVDAAEGFIQHGNRVCILLSETETIRWIDRGLDVCKTQSEIINYFNGTSLKSIETSDILVSGVALKNKQNILSIICEALLGHPVKIRSNTSLLGCDGFTGGAATDGVSIFLPKMAPNFGLFKLMTLHQAMLLRGLPYTGLNGGILSDPVQIHLDADQRLTQQLPGLLVEMDKQLDADQKDRFPDTSDHPRMLVKPWWGDILPTLIKETDDTITLIKEKAFEEYEDIPEELLDILVASLLSGGERKPDALWKMLGEMLENIEFASPDAEELQEKVKTYFYKEWDRNISDYKIDWCQVRQRIAREDPNDFVEKVNERLRGIILLIRKQFMKLKPETFKKYKAQPIGDALDIDALVQALTDMRSGAAMSENVYIRRDKRIRDVSVFFLVDLSGSTDEVINGRKVIDIQKEAMAIMAEALETLGDPYAIYGFSTEGRFRVDMFTVKDFKDEWDEKTQYRLGNMQPNGLTRMGTVVRHATHKLEQVPSVIKLLVILTDGRPYDMEYGNLEYAISDTKKAIQEARSKNIHPF